MKKKLALFLAAVMCVSSLCVGCGTGENGNSTEKNTEQGTEVKVELTELYKKGKFETADLSEYVTLGAYAGIIKLEEKDYVVTEADIQAEIDQYRLSYGTKTEEKERDVVQKGDIVTIDYVGRIDGIKFEGGSATGSDLEIGSGQFIDGFEDGLIGAKKGSTVDVVTKFPDPYTPNPDLAGREAIFTVTINKISVMVPADYDDELVSKITNKIYTTVTEFNKYIELQLKAKKKNEVMNKFLTELAKVATFKDKTNELVDAGYDAALKYYESYAKMYGMDLDKFATAMGFKDKEELCKLIREEAKLEAQQELLTYAYGRAMGFELTDEIALAVLDDLVWLQGSKSREDVLTSFGVETVRTECYREALADIVINNYK